MNLLKKSTLLLFASLTLSSYAETTEQPIEEPQWYQVEVIIFSQQDMFQEEQPRTDIDLIYPENWLQLIDPNAAIAGDELTEDSNGDSPTIEESPANPVLSAAVINLTLTPDELPPKPKEQPFILLPEDEQRLGPDHYTLRRTPGYRVLYHQAWRQPGLNFDDAPWILIQSGDLFDDHHELEGSIRLVRSRYLHLQANLWKTRFDPVIRQPLEFLEEESEALWPELPEVPQPPQPIPEEGLEDRLEINTSDIVNADIPLEAIPSEPEFSETTLIEPVPASYNIRDIMTLKQSLKLSRNKLGYLDHPSMGVLVLVSRYPAKLEE